MNEKKFIEMITNLLDLEEEPSIDDELSNYEEWDSLAFITFLATASKISRERILPNDIKSAKTIRDLFNLIK